MSEKPVSSGRLLAGILGQMEIGQNIANAININQDIAQSLEVYKLITADAADVLTPAQNLTKLLMKDGFNILKTCIQELPNDMSQLLQFWRNQSGQSATGFPMTAAAWSNRAKYYAQDHYVDLKDSLIFDHPESIAKLKVQRWYNQAIRPTILSISTALSQYNRGGISKARRDEILSMNGVPDADMPLLQDEIENYPNVNAFIRYASIMPFTDDSVRWLCKVNNVTLKPVVDYYVNLLHAVRLRDELQQYLQYLKADFLDGLLTENELMAEIAVHKTDPEEAAQVVANMKNELDRKLISYEVQTQTWLYRKGVLAIEGAELDPVKTGEDLFYDRLIDLGMVAVMANALVRLEASKLSVDWERI